MRMFYLAPIDIEMPMPDKTKTITWKRKESYFDIDSIINMYVIDNAWVRVLFPKGEQALTIEEMHEIAKLLPQAKAPEGIALIQFKSGDLVRVKSSGRIGRIVSSQNPPEVYFEDVERSTRYNPYELELA